MCADEQTLDSKTQVQVKKAFYFEALFLGQLKAVGLELPLIITVWHVCKSIVLNVSSKIIDQTIQVKICFAIFVFVFFFDAFS